MTRKLVLAALILLSADTALAQLGIVQGIPVVARNVTLPSGAAVDLLVLDDATDTIFFQAGVNVSGHGNVVVNSSAGPGNDAVSILGNTGENMMEVHSTTGSRGTFGIDAGDDGVVSLHDGANRTIRIDGGIASDMISLYDSAGTNKLLTIGAQSVHGAMSFNDSAGDPYVDIRSDPGGFGGATFYQEEAAVKQIGTIINGSIVQVGSNQSNGVLRLEGVGIPGFLQYNDLGSNNFRLTIPDAITTSYTVKVPAATPLVGQILSVSAVAAGVADTIWAAPGGGGCPAGANTEIQYNSSGVCGSSSSFTITSAGAMVLTFGKDHTGGAVRTEFGTTAEQRTYRHDIHTSGNVIDYDVRQEYSGGTGSIGQGTLTLHANTFTMGTDVDVTFQTDGATDFGTTAARIGTGYSDTWNTEILQITRASHASHITHRWDGTLYQIENTSGTDMFTLNNGTSQADFAGSVKSETFLIEEGAGFWEMSVDGSNNLEFYNTTPVLALEVDSTLQLRPQNHIILPTGSHLLTLGQGTSDIGQSGTWFDDLHIDDINVRTNILPVFNAGSDLGSDTLEFDDAWFNDQLIVDGNLVLRTSGETNQIDITGSTANPYIHITNTAGTLDLVAISGVNSGVTQGGQIILDNLSGTQRVFIGVTDTGDRGTISANSPGVDVAIRSDSTAADTGLFFDTTKVVGDQGAAVTKPTGGATVDTEARAAIDALIDRLGATSGHGLIAN